jgi:hypothetical protein
VLTTDQKGSIAEAEVACAAMKLGIGVYRPMSDGERYDLIFDGKADSCGFNASGLRNTTK